MNNPVSHPRCGAATLLGVLVVVAITAGALSTVYVREGAAQKRALERAAGGLMAEWLLAAHRATLTERHVYPTSLAVTPQFTVTPAQLRAVNAADPGLRDSFRNATLTLGVMADGAAVTVGALPVAMAFAVLEPDNAEAGGRMRVGALAAGLQQVAVQGGAATPMATHVTGIEAALGRAIPTGALYATADHAVRYLEGALHRGPQPGRRDLNRMLTAVNMDGNDIDDAGLLESTKPPPAPVDPADPGLAVTGDASFGGQLDLAGSATATRVQAATLTAVGTGAATGALGPVTAGRVVSGGAFGMASLDLSGHAGAATADTTGTLTAATLAATSTALTAAANASDLASDRVDLGAGTFSSAAAAATGTHGPAGSITTLTVSGSCSGCGYLPVGHVPPP